MAGFLDRVRGEKETELASKKRSTPAAELERTARTLPVRNFRDAVSVPGAVIAEIKGKSPTVKAFQQTPDPERLAAIYASNGASAISIVTDERNFGTSLRDVQRVRSSCALPVLVKDFIFDRYQILEARASGADAVLLIVRMLNANTFGSLLGHAHELGMSSLVECHDETDIQTAVKAGGRIIGINNRDLRTLEVSVDTTKRLIGEIPPGVISVSESGIDSRATVEALTALGVGAFLVGGALLDSEDPGRKLQELAGVEVEPRGHSGGRDG